MIDTWATAIGAQPRTPVTFPVISTEASRRRLLEAASWYRKAPEAAEGMDIMENTNSAAGRDLIGALVEFAAAPRATAAFVSVVHDGRLVLGGWLPPAGAPAPAVSLDAGIAATGAGTAGSAEICCTRGGRMVKPYRSGTRVVRLLVLDLTNREIADRLSLSRHTVSSSAARAAEAWVAPPGGPHPRRAAARSRHGEAAASCSVPERCRLRACPVR